MVYVDGTLEQLCFHFETNFFLSAWQKNWQLNVTRAQFFLEDQYQCCQVSWSKCDWISLELVKERNKAGKDLLQYYEAKRCIGRIFECSFMCIWGIWICGSLETAESVVITSSGHYTEWHVFSLNLFAFTSHCCLQNSSQRNFGFYRHPNAFDKWIFLTTFNSHSLQRSLKQTAALNVKA